MRRLSIRHITRYRYVAPVTFHAHKLLLRPREGHDIRIASSQLSITPAYTSLWHRDVNDNSVAIIEFQETAALLEIDSSVVIEHYEDAPLQFTLEPYVKEFPFQYDASERAELTPYLQPLFTRDDLALRNWVSEFWSPGFTRSTFDLLDEMNHRIPERLAPMRRDEPGVQRPAETLALGSGSCRDFATLFMEACRHLGIAARFVSGYIHSPGNPMATGAPHAWCEVYLPGAGWRGFDSTIGEHVAADHIAVAVARHPESVPPVSGSYTGTSRPTMEVEVLVEQLP